ncbi:hypothetical protein EN871_09885 [bacterium M00.F.Ca.ET.228.01.1.1]|nr:hypothetical protein EN871_09885 [bacterium M00.F.Ca.ET.228.01.1.1]TGS02765.1 hypothetical protein EN834_09880 [bacterium M00.F.Ca.ET.191.01.1.1]TGU06147.1 hypothetical protein EN798_13960 [bacterium M00.F.Ca.ET.155.01.1.1]
MHETSRKGLAIPGATFETVGEPIALGLKHGYPTIRVVGAGITGARLLNALRRTGVEGDVSFVRMDVDGSAAAADATIPAFEGVDVVVLLVSTRELFALQALISLAEAARNTGALVIAMVAHPPSSGINARSATSMLAEYADALILLPVRPHASTVSSLFHAYISATVDGLSEGFAAATPEGADFLDVRSVFAGRREAHIGMGQATGTGRAARAATAAIIDLEPANLRNAHGALVLIAGSRLLRLKEIAEVANEVFASLPGDASRALGVHYDERLDTTLRVTIITSR